MAELAIVKKFVQNRQKRFESLLKSIRHACARAEEELGSQQVVRHYSRGKKQNGEELKDTHKILEACARPVNDSNLLNVEDVIGLTIVVQYSDQIPSTLDKITAILAEVGIVEKVTKVHTETYFATHRVYQSNRVGDMGLCCEVQCKTMLHDAWANKMHDLTYKPSGTMDERMRGLVEAISMTLEGLEGQSMIVRDIITGRQTAERRPFEAALSVFMRGLSHERQANWDGDDVPEYLRALRADLTDNIEAIRSRDLSDKDMSELARRINFAFEEPSQMLLAWVLAIEFATARCDRDGQIFLADLSELFLDALPELCRHKRIPEQGIRSIPVGCYAAQDFARALEVTDHLLQNAGILELTDECQQLMKFNKATWLLERESVKPSKPAIAQQIAREVTHLLEGSRNIVQLKDPVSLKDTDGLMLIVFGTSKEDIRRGMAMCIEAGQPVAGDLDDALAASYAEWRTDSGWRRYFELSERQA